MRPHTETDAKLILEGDRLEHTIYRADSLLERAVGVMGRRGVPAGSALVFPFDHAWPQSVHMVGVRAPITVWWIREGTIVETATLAAWTGHGSARADLVVELPADAPEPAVGTAVRLES